MTNNHLQLLVNAHERLAERNGLDLNPMSEEELAERP